MAAGNKKPNQHEPSDNIKQRARQLQRFHAAPDNWPTRHLITAEHLGRARLLQPSFKLKDSPPNEPKWVSAWEKSPGSLNGLLTGQPWKSLPTVRPSSSSTISSAAPAAAGAAPSDKNSTANKHLIQPEQDGTTATATTTTTTKTTPSEGNGTKPGSDASSQVVNRSLKLQPQATGGGRWLRSSGPYTQWLEAQGAVKGGHDTAATQPAVTAKDKAEPGGSDDDDEPDGGASSNAHTSHRDGHGQRNTGQTHVARPPPQTPRQSADDNDVEEEEEREMAVGSESRFSYQDWDAFCRWLAQNGMRPSQTVLSSRAAAGSSDTAGRRGREEDDGERR
ncbi:hypothetical protein QBC39DRAFT_386715 [Podospora conica]|nr:hypothetical protein QBC39DRAFT_386715 [Schizothecium conicum]